MKQVENWFFYNDLIINTEITKVLLFQQGSESGSIIRPILHFRTKELNYSSNFKFLEIYIMENLKWYTHIQYLCYNLSKVFYIIKSLLSYLIKTALRRRLKYTLFLFCLGIPDV